MIRTGADVNYTGPEAAERILMEGDLHFRHQKIQHPCRPAEDSMVSDNQDEPNGAANQGFLHGVFVH